VTAATHAAPRREAPFFDIEMLPAGHGDALWIEYGDANVCHRVLVDCGTQQTGPDLLRRIEQLPDNARRLELFVMSHIDADHIGGALRFLGAVQQGLRIDDTWFNGWRHVSGSLGARQGEMFSTAIQDLELRWNDWREGQAIVIDSDPLPVCQLPGGMKLTLLSPQPAELKKLAPVWTRELKRYGLEPGSRVDYSRFLRGTPSTSTDVESLAAEPFSGDAGAPNGSSIALLAEYGNAAALLGADAYAPVLAASIKRLLQNSGQARLKLDAFKVAHHGSRNNLSNDLLDLVACPRYLLSTNGDHFYHPDRQAVARIIEHGGERPSLYFNYRTRYNEVWGGAQLQEQYAYTAHFPADAGSGSVVSLLAPRL
jgi:beta-lactamase superfamily II metal-dependent hydrolase